MGKEDLELSLRERFASAQIDDPIGLARLVALVGQSGDYAPIILDQLQIFLLAHTVEYCREHVPYYGRLQLPALAAAMSLGFDTLALLPLLDRRTAQLNAGALTAQGAMVQQVIHTSGSTGEPLQILKSGDEIRFLQAYYGELLRNAVRPGQERPLILSLPNLYHGSAIALPSIGMPLVGGVTDDTLIEDAARVLVGDHDLPGFGKRVSAISGLYFQVLFLTSFLCERGVVPAELRVNHISITGGYLAAYWLDFLGRTWNCLVNDRYSLTEVVGGASRLGDGRFRLDPILIGEVIDVDTHEVVTEGVGELVLTSFYPLVQLQPLLRYRTGDLVAIAQARGKRVSTFEFLGKTKNCISIMQPGGARCWLSFSSRMMDILAPLPDVQYYNWFANVRVARDRSVGSLPLYRWEMAETGRRPELRLMVELRHSPHLYPERERHLHDLILDALRADVRTGFAAWEASDPDRVSIAFVGPGGVATPPYIKV